MGLSAPSPGRDEREGLSSLAGLISPVGRYPALKRWAISKENRRLLNRAALNVDFGRQRLMDRTFPRDFHQPGALFVGERAVEMNLERDAIDLAFLGFAFLAIRRMDFEMTK